jgi:hypothetical protein
MADILVDMEADPIITMEHLGQEEGLSLQEQVDLEIMVKQMVE